MAQMLAAYYSKGANNEKFFANLNIANYKDIDEFNEQCPEITFTTYLNKFDVIYIDMNTINRKYKSYLETNPQDKIFTLPQYLQYLVINELKENSTFAEILDNNKIGKTDLADALVALNQEESIGKPTFIFIMDEWDLIYREYRDDVKLQKEFIEFLKGLFKDTDSVNCFSLVYLTGILPIKKYNSQSALNNFIEYNMLTPEPYEEYFGFTEDEVATIVQQPFCRISQAVLKKWYQGYELAGRDIYNPNSVSLAVSSGKCRSYWGHTTSNEEVVRLINMNFKGIKDDIITLIEGARVKFNCGNFQNDMVNINDKNDALCLLVCLGYLGCVDDKSEYEDETESSSNKIAYVPNTELKECWKDIIRKQDWYHRIKAVQRSEELLKAIKEQDGETVARLIQEIHTSPAVALLEYNNEKALTYCVMAGLMWSTLDDYTYHKEAQAGEGRVDLVYKPRLKSLTQPVILIEFKYGHSAEEALAQIKNKKYDTQFINIEEYNTVLMVGINYDTKTKEHQCVIEKRTRLS